MNIRLNSVMVDNHEKALFDAGIPLTAFESTDIHAEYRRLTGHGVKFRGEPVKTEQVTTAVFEDTCGNLIDLRQTG